MKIRQPTLYLLVLASAITVVIIALGGGLFSQQGPWQLQWQHSLFSDLCHQIAERSFWLNGQPMAVCSRCLGIYSGFLTGLLLMLVHTNNVTLGWPAKKIAVLILILNFIDVIGNSLGFWQNTLISRLVLGYMIGHSAAFILAKAFLNKTIESTESYYGRITARSSH